MNASEFIQYCKDKYVGKVIALKHSMCLCSKNGSVIIRDRGYTDVIEDVCAIGSSSVKFCFKEYSATLNFYRFKEVNPCDGCRVVSDLFEIVNN